MIDTVWRAIVPISTGDIVAAVTGRAITKALSGNTNIIGISQFAIASGSFGVIRNFGLGIVNVGPNIVDTGDLIVPSVTGGIGISATVINYYGSVAGISLERGTGIKRIFIYRM